MLWAVVLLCLVASQASAKTKIRDLIEVCSRTDANNAGCVQKAANVLIPKFSEGVRDLGIIPIDPLAIPFLELNQDNSQLGLKMNITDSKHRGLKDSKVTGVKTDNNGLHLEVDLDVPYYEVVGTCDVGGKILLLPITGHGFCNLTANNLQAKLNLQFEPTKKHDKPHLKISSLIVKVKTRKGHFLLEGLFGGNKELADTMNRFLNENSADVLVELKPTLETVWAAIFENILKNFFDKLSLDELSNA